jgi:hypothetical protein
MDYNIQTISYGAMGEANKMDITVIPFLLGSETTSLSVNIKNDEKIFESKKLDIPQDIYESWGTDDSIIIEWVCEELGLTLV